MGYALWRCAYSKYCGNQNCCCDDFTQAGRWRHEASVDIVEGRRKEHALGMVLSSSLYTGASVLPGQCGVALASRSSKQLSKFIRRRPSRMRRLASYLGQLCLARSKRSSPPYWPQRTNRCDRIGAHIWRSVTYQAMMVDLEPVTVNMPVYSTTRPRRGSVVTQS